MEHSHDKPQSFHASPAGGAAGAGGGVPLPRLPARGHRRRRSRTSSPSSTPRRAGSSTRRRCRTSATSCTTSAGTAASSACHGPDRSHLIVPGFRSLAHPHRQRGRRPAPAADREGDRAGGDRREDRLHAAAHRPLHAGRQHRRRRCSATPRATAPAASPSLDAKTFEIKGRWENGGATPPLNYDFWYQPRKNVLVSCEFGEPNAYESGFDLEDVEAGRYGQRIHFWNLERADARADDRPRREGARAARGALAARPRGRAGLRRRRAVERRCGASAATTALGRPSR